MPPMDLSTGTLLTSLLVGSVGFGIFLYGKKQLRGPQLVVGGVMMAYPYFITGPLAMLGIAGLLIALLVGALRMGM